MLPIGEKANPQLRFSDVSSRSGFAPSTCGAPVLTGKIPTCTGTPAITFVTTLLKYSWLIPGARKPVLAAPRSVSSFDGW